MEILHELPPLPEPGPTPRRRRGMPWWAKGLVGLVGGLAGLLGAAVVTLRVPAVQTRAVSYLSDLAQRKTGFNVRFGAVDLNFYDQILLHDVVAWDKEGNRMIDVPELSVDFALARILTREVALDNVLAKHGHVRILTNPQTGVINITQFVDSLNHWLNPDTTPNKNPPNFYIFSAGLSDFQLTISDPRKDSIRDGFDYRHMHFDGITAVVENFRARADTIELNLHSLRARDVKTRWQLHRLTTQFRMTKRDMTFAPFQLWVGHSYLSDTLQFRYAKKADMSDIVNKVTMRANFKGSRIDYRDLTLFAPSMRRLHDSVRISGRLRGAVPDFTLDRMQARFGSTSGTGSEVVGKVRMQGLPGWDTTRMDIALRPSFIHPEDLQQYVPASAYTYLQRLGPTDLEGTFKGLAQDFVFKGGVYGRNGTLVADMRMKLDLPVPRYDGTFTAENLTLGRVLAQPMLGTVTGRGRVIGKGFTLATAQVAVKGNFDRLDLYGYPYRHIVTDAELKRQKFDGYLKISDTNLLAEMNGLVDLSQPRKVFDAKLNLQRARLMALGWTNRKVRLKGFATLKGSGSDADDAEGIIRLRHAFVKVNDEDLAIDSLDLATRRQGSQRQIRLDSDYLSGSLEGDFTFRAIAADLEAALNDYGRLFNNRTAERNRTAVYSGRDYTAALRLDLLNMTPLLRIAAPGMQLAPHASLTADLTKNTNLLIQTDLAADYLAYGESVFDAVRADLVTSKSLDEHERASDANVLASASVSSASQRFGNLVTKGLNLEGVWSKGLINFSTAIQQDNDSNYVDLQGRLGFEPGQIVARLDSANIRLLDSTWRVSPRNRIVYNGGEVSIDSLSFASTGQRVEVFGTAGAHEADTLHVSIDSLSAAFVKAFLKGDYTGKTSVHLDMARLTSAERSVAGVLQILGFGRDGLPLGDITASLRPQPADASLLLDVKVDKDSIPVLRGGGVLRPTSLERQLNLDFRLRQAPIAYLEPLFTGLASDWTGMASGHISLTGALNAPILNGSAYINGGAITVDYLKTRYYFSDSVRLAKGLISATGLRLRDVQGHTATLTQAQVRHNYFSNFYIDVEGDVDGLQLLSTTYKDSKLYYGTAYATGQMSIKGPVGDIVIAATLRTERGTKLYLPLQSALATNTTQQSFIIFDSAAFNPASDSLARVKQDSLDYARARVNLSGIRLAFNIEVTPDASGEIIFDRQTGDGVVASGNGRMKLNIDTRGDFSMVGRYNITSGQYKFTFANVIDKTFDILDGSSITWSGDPAAGVLDIQARYPLSVPFSPLLIGQLYGRQDSAQIAQEGSRRYPVNVNMNLAGPMLTPNISLGLDIPNQYPNTLSPYVTSLQGLIQSSEQELNKQVFSLLLLRSLSPTGVGGYASASSGVGNLTELLSNQLSAWLSQVNQNLEVGVNLNGFNQSSLENFQLRLSYTALDGRLRLTRNGAFTNTASQATAASLAGDWTLEYNLTRDGKLRLKAFHRTNQTLANTGLGLGNQYSTTSQGVSVLHTSSFNNLRELLPWLYKTKVNRLPQGPETAPTTTDPVPAKPKLEPGQGTDVSKEKTLPPKNQPEATPTALLQPKE